MAFDRQRNVSPLYYHPLVHRRTWNVFKYYSRCLPGQTRLLSAKRKKRWQRCVRKRDAESMEKRSEADAAAVAAAASCCNTHAGHTRNTFQHNFGVTLRSGARWRFSQAASSVAAAVAVDRLARGPELRSQPPPSPPLQPRSSRLRTYRALADRPGPGDIFDGTVLPRRCADAENAPPMILGILYNGSGGMLHQLPTPPSVGVTPASVPPPPPPPTTTISCWLLPQRSCRRRRPFSPRPAVAKTSHSWCVHLIVVFKIL